MALSTSSQGDSPITSRNKKSASSAPTSALTSAPLNPFAKLATPQVSKYTKDDLQQIYKTALEAWPFATQKDFNKSQEQTLKPRSPDVYKSKSHIDRYNFIQ